MDREHAIARLSDYLEGEMTASERAEMETLLAEDAELRRELEALRATLDALGSLPAEQPPPDFVRGLQRKLRRKNASWLDISFGFERKIPFEAVSILLLGILLALYLILVALPGDDIAPPEPRPTAPAASRDAGPPMDSGSRTPPAHLSPARRNAPLPR